MGLPKPLLLGTPKYKLYINCTNFALVCFSDWVMKKNNFWV